ncbi:MAG: hypothetical protein M3680_21785 [Myxococcota bacterium]|nr:hypothetical protein [Myxococcota bacterium]
MRTLIGLIALAACSTPAPKPTPTPADVASSRAPVGTDPAPSCEARVDALAAWLASTAWQDAPTLVHGSLRHRSPPR